MTNVKNCYRNDRGSTLAGCWELFSSKGSPERFCLSAPSLLVDWYRAIVLQGRWSKICIL